jgi:hypothetical protein
MSAFIRATKIGFGIIIFFIFTSCTKETIHVPDNDAPIINNVPSIKIENYINRVFIDLIGREPFDSEMEMELNALKNAGLTKESREALIAKLQTNTDFIEGDTSYTQAYHQHLYDLAKIRCLEGKSDSDIADEIGDAEDPADALRLQMVLSSRKDLQNGLINYNEVFARMVYNLVYDEINMNTFNFVNATFDNLLWRFPTNAEFQEGYEMVEYNNSAVIFGEVGQNKTDYVNIISNSREIYEGMIIWAFQQILSRPPSTEETAALLEDFINHQDIKIIQRQIMATDEYANF